MGRSRTNKIKLVLISSTLAWISGFCYAYLLFHLSSSSTPVVVIPVKPSLPPPPSLNITHHDNGTITIQYPPFVLPRKPKFIDSTHQAWWPNDTTMCQGICDRGDIISFDPSSDQFAIRGPCGQSGSLTLLVPSAKKKQKQNDTTKPLLWVPVPDSYSIQHFIDGTLPKYAQLDLATGFFSTAAEKKKKAYAVQDLDRRRFPAVGWMTDELGLEIGPGVIKPDRVSQVMYLCHTPPLHPILWKHGQRLLGTLTRPIAERTKIVYLSRHGGTFNRGRRIDNEVEFLDRLRGVVAKETRKELVTFVSSEYKDLDALRTLFRDTWMVIGPHGGAFSNIMFLSPPAKVIEFVPMTTDTNHHGMPLFIFATQSLMLDLDYYGVPSAVTDPRWLNMNVDVPRVMETIERILNE